MRSWLARAREADRAGETAEAIEAYERALAASEALGLADYLDLVALYVEASDYGNRPRIPEDIRARTYEGAGRALKAAEDVFGGSAELACWRAYVEFREFGSELPESSQLERWRSEGSELADVLIGISRRRGEGAPPRRSSRHGRSTRERLLRSLKEALPFW